MKTLIFREQSSPGMTLHGSLAHHTIVVGVIHVLVCGMSTVYRGNPMATRFCAGDAAIPIVIVHLKCAANLFVFWRRSWCRVRRRFLHNHFRGRAARQDAHQRIALSLIDGETVPLSYLHCATCEPAAIHVGKPFRYVLTALLKAIDRRTGQGEVEKVRGKLSPSTQST